MESFVVEVEKNKVIVDTNFLSVFFKRNKSTIRSWKNNKEMPVYRIDDKGIIYYDLFIVVHWHKINIKEKFNKNKSKEIDENIEEEFDFKLPYDLELADIDLENSLHLSILAAHPMGEMIRDTLSFVKDYNKKEAEVEAKKYELEVKKGKYLEVAELNKILVETFTMLKESDVNSRTMIPVSIVDYLIMKKIIAKDKKSETIEKIIELVDEVFEENWEICKSQFMKHISTKESKINFLKKIIEDIENDSE